MTSPRTIHPANSPPLIAPQPQPALRSSTLSKSIASPFPPQTGTSPSIPNIPPRTSSSSSFARPRTLSNSYRPTASPRDTKANRLDPKPSFDNLIGRKTSPVPQTTTSALTAQLGSSPRPPQPTPPKKSSRPDLYAVDLGLSNPRGSDASFSHLAEVTNEEKARVLRRHLVSAEERRPSASATPAEVPSPGDASPIGELDSGVQGGSIGSGTSSHEGERSGHFPLPYDALGGDVTHDLYKWQHDHRPQPGRSASFSHIPLDRSAILDPTLAHIKEPGGFRRNFVVNRAQAQGLEAPTIVRNVIDFLFLYGHFAGEDLEEDEDESEEDDAGFQAEAGHGGYARNQMDRSLERGHNRVSYRERSADERAPLLGPGSRAGSKTRSHRRTKSGPPVGTASVLQATLMLLKGFVGTGILFMGKAFFNGGILFSSIVLLSIAAISLWSFLLLVQVYMKVPGSFGDIGGMLYGNTMRVTILTSIAVSQMGFVAAYTIFIAENLQAFIMAVTDCRTFIATRYLIFGQLLVFLPLAMIRNLAKLSGTALVADLFIVIGLVYIGGNEGRVLATKGLADVQLFNRDNFPLLIGTAVFAFEGIGLVIPLTESMREPQKFPRVLSGVMLVVAVLFAGFGAMGYAAYGSDIQTVVIVNLPQDDKFVQVVQLIYSVAILLSMPLQLFPAVRIMENGLFSRSGKHNSSVKWQKNVFRAGTVLFCTLVSWAGSNELDKFVSLIGSFACIPLCFIYPPMLHLQGYASTRRAKVLDIVMIVFGVMVGGFTTVQTIRSLFASGSGEAPRFGKCEVPRGL